jgi:hypothetical protein
VATIRPFEPGDALEAAKLFMVVSPESGWASAEHLAQYLRKVLCESPWCDPEIPSWVAIENGKIIGVESVVPRPMMHGERVIRAAVSCQTYVHPENRGITGIQLTRALLSGPQDVTIADGASLMGAKVMEALGALVSPLHRMSWIRPLRPAQAALALAASRRQALRPLAVVGTPFAALADACLTRIPPLRCLPRLHEEELDPAKLLAAFDELGSQFTLRPVYDINSLDWLYGQLAAKNRHGPLQARLVRDAGGKVAGWFIYYLNSGLSRVLQIMARKDTTRPVLEHLFRHAADRGTVALEGRIEPRFTYDMGNMHCFFHSSSELTLLHARDPAIMASLMQGDAFFTRMEGEWWLRFHGEPHAKTAEATPCPKNRPEAGRRRLHRSAVCLLPSTFCLLAADL